MSIDGDVEEIQRIPMSWEEYVELPEQSWPRIEYSNGAAIVNAMARRPHQRVTMRLARLLDDVVGLEALAGANVRVETQANRIPDIVVMPDDGGDEVYIESPPVAVVEVLSRSTRSEDLFRKPAQYAAMGIRQFWVVDIDSRFVEVFENRDGEWQTLVRADASTPTVEVRIEEYGSVTIDLDGLFG